MEIQNKAKTLKICVRCPNWLGDLFMATAFVKRLLDQYPDAEIDLIVKQGFESLPLPHRGEIIPFKKTAFNSISFGLSLTKKNYDQFYVLPPSVSAAVMAFFSGAKQRIGLQGTGRNLFLTQPIAYDQSPRSQHLIDEFDLLLEGKTETSYPYLPIEKSWVETELTTIDLPNGFIALAPGAIYGPAKEWPLTHWQELARLLIQQGQIPVVIGQAGDFELELPKGAINLCGQTNLKQLIALLTKAKLLVSNDSGAMHVMSSLSKPQIAIFGSTSKVWTGPRNRLAQVITLDLDCAPCFKRTCQFETYDCLQKITPLEVLKKTQSFGL